MHFVHSLRRFFLVSTPSRLYVFTQKLPDASFQADTQQFLGFDGELHGKFFEHFLGVAVDNQADSAFLVDAALLAVKQLVVGDFRGGGLMFHYGRLVVAFDIWPGVGTALVTHQQRVAL